MNLFKSSDIINPVSPLKTPWATGTAAHSPATFVSGEQMELISSTINWLAPGNSFFFVTDGAWSNIELLEYCLQKTGPAEVYFCTWAISAEAITRFAAWQEDGTITGLWAILDTGLSNRKPDVYQQAIGAFKYLRTRKCHAKVTVIQNHDHQLVIMGSANYTKNPRREAGVIIWDKTTAEANIKWILEEFADD